jgi:hypothetical protein
MSGTLNEISQKLSLIDAKFNVDQVEDDELEKYVEDFFSRELAKSFPQFNKQLKKNISLFLHPDKIKRPDSVLKNWRKFLEKHPNFDSGIPFKTLDNISVNSTLNDDILDKINKIYDELVRPYEELIRQYKEKEELDFEKRLFDKFYTKKSLRLMSLSTHDLLERFRFIDIHKFKNPKALEEKDLDLDLVIGGVDNPDLKSRLIDYFFIKNNQGAKYFPEACKQVSHFPLSSTFLRVINESCIDNDNFIHFLNLNFFSRHSAALMRTYPESLRTLMVNNEELINKIYTQFKKLEIIVYCSNKIIKELFKLGFFVVFEIPFILLVSLPRFLYNVMILSLINFNEKLYDKCYRILSSNECNLWKDYYPDFFNAYFQNKKYLADDFLNSELFYYIQLCLFLQNYTLYTNSSSYQSFYEVFGSYHYWTMNLKDLKGILDVEHDRFFIFAKLNNFIYKTTSLFNFYNGLRASLDFIKTKNFGLMYLLKLLTIPLAFSLKITSEIFNLLINTMHYVSIYTIYSLSTILLKVLIIWPANLLGYTLNNENPNDYHKTF